ncbi:transketolase [Floccifex sp.]|uniref:transketolase n=1 Tax=Floccifex sp. TaxID=2815810 RepID=UPI003F10233B
MDALTRKSYELRKDIIEMMHKSKAGHVGGDLSVIDILNVLYNEIMNVSPENFKDDNRDRFLLSKGHCADALFVVLGDKGFFDKQEAIDTFSQYNSKFIGHPNTDVNGIEINSGSLGHGLAIGVGMAIAGKMDSKSYRTYVVLGDGEMAEGSNYEAMMAASQYKLDNLCATVDLNHLQISGTTDEVMSTSSLSDKFLSFGWNVIEVEDGNDCAQLVDAYHKAEQCKGRPSVVMAHTVKGKGVSYMENEKAWHHGVMSDAQYQQAIKELKEALA